MPKYRMASVKVRLKIEMSADQPSILVCGDAMEAPPCTVAVGESTSF